jgi:ribosomal protein S27AE
MTNSMIFLLMAIGAIALMVFAYLWQASTNRKYVIKQRKNMRKLENQVCPECGRPMEIGFLATRGTRWSTKEDIDKSFGRLKFLGGILPAGLCQACRRGVFLLPEDTKI